jgi:hypothetical protein
MLRLGWIVLLLSVVWCADAADIPVIVNENNAESNVMCVDRAANDCINTVCPNSPDINCSDNCLKEAKDKCEGMMEE